MKKFIVFFIIIVNLFSKETILDSDYIEQSFNNNDNEALIKLIDAGYNINSQDDKGYSLLMKAIIYNNVDLVYYLIDKGIDLNVKSTKGYTAVSIGMQVKDLEFVNYLISKGAKIDKKSDILSNAIANDEFGYEMVSFLLKNGIDINRVDTNMLSPLMNSAYRKRYDITKLLLNNGADVGFVNQSGVDILMLLLADNVDDLAKVVISKGIDIIRRDSHGNNYLHYAVKSKNMELVKLLCDLGVNPLAKNFERETPRDLANDDIELLKILINKNSTINDTLFHALEVHDDKLALSLCEKIINANIFNDKSQSVISLAIKNGNLDIVKALVKKGADINQYTDRTYTTPLIEAIKLGYTEIALYLLSKWMLRLK